MKSAYDIIIKPIITEKPQFSQQQTSIHFAVDQKANKVEIKKPLKKSLRLKLLQSEQSMFAENQKECKI